jgi:hypothetical protein
MNARRIGPARTSRERPGAAADRALDARLLSLRRLALRVEPRPSLLDEVRRVVRTDVRRRRRPRRVTLGLAASLLLSFALGAFRGATPTESPGATRRNAAGLASLAPESRHRSVARSVESADERFAALVESGAALPDADSATLARWSAALADPDPDIRALARLLLRDARMHAPAEDDEGDNEEGALEDGDDDLDDDAGEHDERRGVR